MRTIILAGLLVLVSAIAIQHVLVSRDRAYKRQQIETELQADLTRIREASQRSKAADDAKFDFIRSVLRESN
jgi:hypothetical protein